MKAVVALVIYVVWGIIAFQFAAPAKPTVDEFTFGNGLFHGLSWFLLWIMKSCGAAIYIFAEFNTWGYVIGFVIGVALSLPILLSTISTVFTDVWD